MQYKTKSQQIPLLCYAFLYLIMTWLSWDTPALKWITLTGFILFLSMSFLRYTLVINDQYISYSTYLFSFRLYTREVSPIHIKQILFKRTGFMTKAAIIKLNKGASIRVLLFKPDNIFRHLVTFCEQHNIHYKKTRDYTLIENA